MMLLPSQMEIWLSCKPVDMRKAIDGLSILVADHFGENPASNRLFVFRNRYRNKIKILYWDRNGFCLWYKRLEKERFHWPESQDEKLELTIQQLQWLLDGLDFMTLNGHKHYHYDNVLTSISSCLNAVSLKHVTFISMLQTSVTATTLGLYVFDIHVRHLNS